MNFNQNMNNMDLKLKCRKTHKFKKKRMLKYVRKIENDVRTV